jgi:hypothetical protein
MVSEEKGLAIDLYGDLLSAAAVRQRCFKIGEIAMNGNANWFAINEPRFSRCVSLVKESCLKNYPDLNIPMHSRWRHFAVNGKNLWQHYTSEFSGSKLDLARSAVDLVFLSVLLDAGAGNTWKYRDPVTGNQLSRSEGLAAASIDLFFNHSARYEGDKGWILDIDSLEKISRGKLGVVFQSSTENPLLGITGRAELLARLTSALNLPENISAGYSRPGSIIDECLAISSRSIFLKKQIDITTILDIVLKRFSSIWPQGYTIDGDPPLHLGDCGYHSALETDDVTSGIIPFHKLSQWLTYSLVEPLQWAGISVTNLDGLTGLPEYRNGGLLIDTGLLTPHDMELMVSKLSPESEAIVEWRALTVFMVDRIAVELRKSLKLSAKRLPLGSVLQGGTWAAGRELALRLRKDGSPPLNISTDGTIF